MSINGVNSANGCGGLYQAAPGCEMSAESLLMFCAGQLNNINSEINACIRQQEHMQDLKQVLSEIKSALAEQAAIPHDRGNWQNIEDAFKKAIEAFPTDDPNRAKLIAHMEEIFSGKYSAGASKERIDAEISKIDTMFEEIKGNMEINMLRLQSAVSAKQTQLQLVTNMLSKMDQTLLAIVKNV